MNFFNYNKLKMTIPLIPAIDINSYIAISIILYLLNRITGISWSSSFILLKPFGFKLFDLSKSKDISYISKKLNIQGSHNVDTDKTQAGMFYGKWYIGSVIHTHNGHESNHMYLLCQEKIFDQLIKDKNAESGDKNEQLTEEKNDTETAVMIYERSNVYFRLEYNSRKLIIKTKTPTPKQRCIIESIIDIYNKKNHAVVLVSGPPSSGKSIMTFIIAQMFKCSYCSTFDPTTPGDSFDNLYSCAVPSKKKPIVVLMDEVDIIIDSIHHQMIKRHKDIAIPIINKTTWNKFFDDIDNDLYPYVIFILTSNKDKSYFDALDSSYMRGGRVDQYYELTKQD